MNNNIRTYDEKTYIEYPIVSPLLQLIFIIFSVSIIGLALYSRIEKHIFTDTPPQIKYFTPNTLREFKTSPLSIKTGLHINKFQKFDMEDNHFIFSGILWFKFDPGSVSLDTLEKFDFEKGEILNRSEPDMQYVGEKLLVRYKIKVKFSTPLNYKDFPLDNHRIFIKLANTNIFPEEMMFNTAEKNFCNKSTSKRFRVAIYRKKCRKWICNHHLIYH